MTTGLPAGCSDEHAAASARSAPMAAGRETARVGRGVCLNESSEVVETLTTDRQGRDAYRVAQALAAG